MGGNAVELECGCGYRFQHGDQVFLTNDGVFNEREESVDWEQSGAKVQCAKCYAKPKLAVVALDDGLIEDVVAEPGVVVEVREFDAPEDERLAVDGRGRSYRSTVWKGRDLLLNVARVLPEHLWCVLTDDVLEVAAQLGARLTPEQLEKVKQYVRDWPFESFHEGIVEQVEELTGIKPCDQCGLYKGSSDEPCQCEKEVEGECQLP